jgi:hypothetical protein
MDPEGVRSAAEALLTTDLAAADRDGVAEAVAMISRLRGWLDAVEVSCAQRSRALADDGASEPPESVLSRAGRRSGKQARDVVDRSKLTDEMPDAASALSDGEIAAGHVDAMASAAKTLDDEQRAEFVSHADALLDSARRTSVDAFERECREFARSLKAAGRDETDAAELERQRSQVSVKRWIDKTTGMHHSHLELDPVRDAAVWSAIDAQLRTLRAADGNSGVAWNQLQADAVVAAAGAGPQGERVPEITVLVDHDTLVSGSHAGGICETDDGVPLPVSTVRRLCCDAEVLPAVLNGDGEVLDVGRSRRTANRAQRRALRAMHRTCAHPDCTVPFSACRIHHVEWWWRHLGPTDIDNLLPLCERHHHLVHEGGWGLTLQEGRVATWTRPNGTVWHTGPTIDRSAAPHSHGHFCHVQPPGRGHPQQPAPSVVP